MRLLVPDVEKVALYDLLIFLCCSFLFLVLKKGQQLRLNISNDFAGTVQIMIIIIMVIIITTTTTTIIIMIMIVNLHKR